MNSVAIDIEQSLLPPPSAIVEEVDTNQASPSDSCNTEPSEDWRTSSDTGNKKYSSNMLAITGGEEVMEEAKESTTEGMIKEEKEQEEQEAKEEQEELEEEEDILFQEIDNDDNDEIFIPLPPLDLRDLLDTCLTATDMQLVGRTYSFLRLRGLLPNFGRYRNISECFSSSF